MKDSRRSSSTYTESLFLHVAKHIFRLFFSIYLFFQEYLRFTGQQVKGEAISLFPFYHFQPLHRYLDISWVIAVESSPLCIAGSRNRAMNLLVHVLQNSLFLQLHWQLPLLGECLILGVTLGNISRVLSNLTKRLIFAVFKDSSSFPIFTQLTVMFSLHQLRLLLALTFVPLPYLFGQCHDMYIQLGRVYLQDG